MQRFQALGHQIMLSWSHHTLRTVSSDRRYADASQNATYFLKVPHANNRAIRPCDQFLKPEKRMKHLEGDTIALFRRGN